MAVSYLKTFGGLRLESDGQPSRGRSAQRRRLGVMAILAAADGEVSRDRLVGLLWPEASTEAARKLLSESLYVIRRELGEGAITGAGDALQLNPEFIRSDVADFRSMLAAGNHEAAVALHTGPFLDGWYIDGTGEFERWAAAERDHLGAVYADALTRLAKRAEGANDFSEAIRWWRKLAAYDRFSSAAVSGLAQAQAAAGERGAALQTLLAHEAILRQELEAEPGPEIVALAAQLRQAVGRPVRSSVVPRPGSNGPLIAPEMPARSPAPMRSPSRGVIAAAMIGVTVLGIAGVLASRPVITGAPPGGSAPRIDPNRIAVRPFRDLTGRNGQLAADVSEQISAILTGVAPLSVVSPGVVARFDSTVSLDSLARSLQAGTVIEGSITEQGGYLRVRAVINDVATATAVEKTTFEGRRDDSFTLADHATLQIDSLVRLHIGRTVRRRELERGTRQVAALRYVTAGLRALETGTARANEFAVGRALAHLRLADSLFALADKADPAWAQPPLKRAAVAKVLSTVQDSGAFATLTQGIDFATESLRRDSASAAARELRGILYWRRGRQFTAAADRSRDSVLAIADLRGATLRDSLRVGAWSMLARIAWSNADAQAARELAAVAARRDPYYDGQSDILESLFLSQLWIRDWDGARSSCAAGRRQDPANYRFIQCELTLLRYVARRPDEARRAWALVDTLERLPARDSAEAAGRGYIPVYWRAVAAAVSARTGDAARARAEMRALAPRVARLGADGIFAPDRAIVHWLVGEPDSAVAALDGYLRSRPEERPKAIQDALLGPIVERLPR